jgi:hypothetical protein
VNTQVAQDFERVKQEFLKRMKQIEKLCWHTRESSKPSFYEQMFQQILAAMKGEETTLKRHFKFAILY